MYNSKKRALSIISALLGLVLSLGAMAAIALAIKDKVDTPPIFAIGSSLQKFGLDLNLTSGIIQWIILIAVLLIAVINIVLCFKLIKKPMEIDEKYPNLGLKKVEFIILTLVLGAIIPLQLFNKEILAGDMLYTIIVYAGTGVIVLLQIISMFISTYKTIKVQAKPKETVEEKKEEIVPCEEVIPCEEVVPCEKEVIAPQYNVVKKDTSSKMFNSIASDPVLDGFENRIREVKHLKDAGLINEQQASAAIENIIESFLK